MYSEKYGITVHHKEEHMAKPLIVNGIHDYTTPDEYVAPQEKPVQEHLKWFMDQKLGLMMHWAPGCQLGTYESWPLSDGDGTWSQEDFTWADIETCKQQYWNANKTFNPVKFNPANLADLAAECGFKYLLFTSKHHDGFCMFDTKTTDYKITAPDCPFHTNKNADVVGALFREFRKKGLGISLYFSKPDWHSPFYWNPQFGTAPTRNVNYNIEAHPDLWEKYVHFTHEQLRELLNNYGKIDLLWLDGGWVRPDNQHQDIHLEEIIGEIRSTSQPHLIVCNRTCGGKFENVITPEKTVPEAPIAVPWETCTTVGDKFSFHYTDNFKSGHQLVLLLLDVVSKGGNLALNVAPQPDGLLPAPAIRSLRDLGSWLKIFGEGIYGTRICDPCFDGQMFFTKKNDTVYMFYAYKNQPELPPKISFHMELPVKEITSIRTGVSVQFRQQDNTVTLFTGSIPLGSAFYAEGFRIKLK